MKMAYLFTKCDYEGCSYGDKIYLSRAQAEKELRQCQLDTNSPYYNHPKDECRWSVESFILDETIPKIKITKNKGYRLNFEYAGRHYSIQNTGEFGEEYMKLTCKENKDFFVYLCDGAFTCNVLPSMKHGQTYKQTDLSKLQEIINRCIEV